MLTESSGSLPFCQSRTSYTSIMEKSDMELGYWYRSESDTARLV
jgi:hypothetical protein